MSQQIKKVKTELAVMVFTYIIYALYMVWAADNTYSSGICDGGYGDSSGILTIITMIMMSGAGSKFVWKLSVLNLVKMLLTIVVVPSIILLVGATWFYFAFDACFVF